VADKLWCSLSATAPTASEQISRERLALARPQLKTALWDLSGWQPAGSPARALLIRVASSLALRSVAIATARLRLIRPHCLGNRKTAARLGAQTSRSVRIASTARVAATGRCLPGSLLLSSGRSSHASDIIMVCDDSGNFDQARTCQAHDVIVWRTVAALPTDIDDVLLTAFSRGVATHRSEAALPVPGRSKR
jgi:hypothetical protein